MGGQGHKGLFQDVGGEIRAVGADEKQSLHSVVVTVDCSLHTTANVAFWLLPVVKFRAEPGTHLVFGATVIVDLQVMRVDGCQSGQLGQYMLCHSPVEICGPLLAQRWNKAGLAPSRIGEASKKKDQIASSCHHNRRLENIAVREIK